MTKVTRAKVEAQAKARKELWFSTNNNGRMGWSMKWGDKWTYKIRRSSKAEVKEYLAEAYGLTIEEFVAIENGDYEVEDATVEIDPAEYSVSVEAQEVATNAEIKQAAVEEIADESEGEEIFTVTTQNGEIYGLPDCDIAVHGNKIFDLLNHELASFKTAKDAIKAADELMGAFERGEKSFTFLPAESSASEKLKEKIAEILNKPRKKIIDWEAVYKDCAISEMKNLQKEFRKLLKLGEIELAENIFNSIKILCKKITRRSAIENKQKK